MASLLAHLAHSVDMVKVLGYTGGTWTHPELSASLSRAPFSKTCVSAFTIVSFDSTSHIRASHGQAHNSQTSRVLGKCEGLAGTHT